MKIKKTLAAISAVTFLLCGCTKENTTDSSSELPSDMPYNRTVMETENGYYYNVSNPILSMRYREKSTGADIFLCAKPECMHNGSDTCTATYNFLSISNQILYNGSIYFVADISDKETTGYALYKMSLDGTSLDKVGDVAKVKSALNSDKFFVGSLESFFIHRGYAYIPYTLGQNTYADFIEQGIVKMDITTGETETIFKNNDFFSRRSMTLEGGCGDYIYYYDWEESDGGYYRQNIYSGETEFLYHSDAFSSVSAFTEDEYYVISFDENDELLVTVYSYTDFAPNGVVIETGEKTLASGGIRAYEDKLIVCSNSVASVYDKNGQKLGSIVAGEEADDYSGTAMYVYSANISFDISIGKLYMKKYDEGLDSSVMYSCPIEDIASGNGKWEVAYTIAGYETYWDEDPIFTKLNRGN